MSRWFQRCSKSCLPKGLPTSATNRVGLKGFSFVSAYKDKRPADDIFLWSLVLGDFVVVVAASQIAGGVVVGRKFMSRRDAMPTAVAVAAPAYAPVPLGRDRSKKVHAVPAVMVGGCLICTLACALPSLLFVD